MSNTAKLLVLSTAKTTKTTKTAKTAKREKLWKINSIAFAKPLVVEAVFFSCIVNLYVTRQVQPYTLFSRDCRFSVTILGPFGESLYICVS